MAGEDCGVDVQGKAKVCTDYLVKCLMAKRAEHGGLTSIFRHEDLISGNLEWNSYTCTDQHVRENKQLPHCHSFNSTIAVSLNNSSDKADVEVKPRSVGDVAVNVASPNRPANQGSGFPYIYNNWSLKRIVHSNVTMSHISHPVAVQTILTGQ